MPNVKMILEYDGGCFHGWQKQSDVRTVQGELEEKLSLVAGEPVVLTGAGRTDAGCHASHQVASFSTAGRVPLDKLARAVNGLMRGEVVVKEIGEVPESFNARFSAVSRTYRYSIALRPTALLRDRVWILNGPLDAAAMSEGAASLLGSHDFSGFSKISERGQYNPLCVVSRADWMAGCIRSVFSSAKRGSVAPSWRSVTRP